MCSVATSGSPSGAATAAAHQAPNMWAWTSSASARTGPQPFGEIGRWHPLQVRLLGECLGGHVEGGCEREPFGGGVPRVQAGDDPVGPQGNG